MSPEYAWTGMFSEKSDIYAFGVLLLEIITGKRISSFTIGEEGKSLLEYVSQTMLLEFIYIIGFQESYMLLCVHQNVKDMGLLERKWWSGSVG